MRNPIRTPLIIVILAGGRSTRMGRDKSRLLLGGKTFLQRITNAARDLEVPIELITEDDAPGFGPVGGVATAFRRFRFEWALFLSCDTPLITRELLQRIVAHRASRAVFMYSDHRAGFPFLLPQAAEPIVSLLLRRGASSLQKLSEALNAELLRPSVEECRLLVNVNTPADYETVTRLWAARSESKAVLAVRNLTVQRGNTRMISAFSWQVGKGEHWAVLGANGCGKTSLFSALLGYVTPTRGDIFVLGEEYGDSDWPKLRQKIGMVSSSVRQMMAESEPAWITVASGKYAMIDYWGTPGKRDKAEAFALLRKIQCEYLADRPWAYLSQGERQRVLIARALIARPVLLILDEPCAGLDPAAREHFLHFLDRLGRKRGCPSIVLVTHHVEEVMPVFTHLLLMKRGKKLAEGTVRSMMNSALLSTAFDTPIRVRQSERRYTLKVKTVRTVIV